jgi:hypothetical protein
MLMRRTLSDELTPASNGTARVAINSAADVGPTARGGEMPDEIQPDLAPPPAPPPLLWPAGIAVISADLLAPSPTVPFAAPTQDPRYGPPPALPRDALVEVSRSATAGTQTSLRSLFLVFGGMLLLGTLARLSV